jgi:hypothetical protein
VRPEWFQIFAAIKEESQPRRCQGGMFQRHRRIRGRMDKKVSPAANTSK